MMVTYLVVGLFVLLTLLPILGSIYFYKTSKVKPIDIDPERVKDPRYFGHSFSHMMRDALAKSEGGDTIKLSHPEPILRLGSNSEVPAVCENLVVADAGCVMPEGAVFRKEIYAKGDIILIGIPGLRAVFSEGRVTLGSGTDVSRWVDAEGPVLAFDDCSLGISISSAKYLAMGRNCYFKRAYAPQMDFGLTFDATEAEGDPRRMHADRPANVPGELWNAEPSRELLRNVSSVGSDREGGFVDKTIVTSRDLVILDNTFVRGDVRSHKTVRLCDGAVVRGNIFAEGDIVLGEGCWVGGNVFTQENVQAGRNVTVGRKGHLSSIVARDQVVLSFGCAVYGYVSAEGGAFSAPDEIEGSWDRPLWDPVVALSEVEPQRRIVFDDVESYRRFDSGCLRKNADIEEIVLPEGVQSVPRSFCYGCSSLRHVELPSTIRSIDDFAFFGCESLGSIDLRKCTALEHIGESAFEGCSSLRAIMLPSSLLVLGQAALRNCMNLTVVDFGENPQLETIEGHAFMGCSLLPSIKLPESCTSIGISTFFGCESLELLEVPAAVQELGSHVLDGCAACRSVLASRPLADSIAVPEGIKLVVRAAEDGGQAYGS